MRESIGVFFGGKSAEHDVSIITGELVISGLKKLGYPVIPVYIGQDGKWYASEALGELKFFSGQAYKEKLQGLDELIVDLEASRGKIVVKEKKRFGAKTYSIDIAFPALHGQNGEDGTLQGMFEMLAVPYVGCNVTSLGITIDKAFTKLFFRAEGIPTTNFVSFSKKEWVEGKEAVLKNISSKLKGALFIKPARLGSSIGIAKARNDTELNFAIEVALHYGNKVVVEEAVEPMTDITCCVIGHHNLTASLLQESAYEKDFFSYEDKYLKGGGAQLGNAKKSMIIPASLDEDTAESIRNDALRIFRLLGCSGISRVDFLYNSSTGEWFANELNPMPGTLYHHLWKESGIELPELIERLILSAKEKHAESESSTHVFKSEILNIARSTKLRLKGN